MSPAAAIRRSVILFSLALPAMMLTGCGGLGDDGSADNTGGTDSTGVQLTVIAPPTVAWSGINGRTQVIMQFSARDDAGAPLGAEDFDVELRVDDRPVDVESLLNQSAEELGVNLYFSMVLDSSFSMTQHNPPAFEPMKAAARDSYQQVLDLWATRPGDTRFSLIWFGDEINQSQFNVGAARGWLPDDILAIPTPADGAATKLYSAVAAMAGHLKNEYDSGVFNGPRDQYVMLVFSDGADNLSFFDNSGSIADQTLVTTTGASYRQFGTPATTLTEATQAIAGHPRLTTHVIGLGAAINSDELRAIAEAGGGVFQSNPSSTNIAELFRRVMNEFTTIQTRGANIPLPPGDYQMSLIVRNRNTGETARHDFSIRAGSPAAALL